MRLRVLEISKDRRDCWERTQGEAGDARTAGARASAKPMGTGAEGTSPYDVADTCRWPPHRGARTEGRARARNAVRAPSGAPADRSGAVRRMPVAEEGGAAACHGALGAWPTTARADTAQKQSGEDLAANPTTAVRMIPLKEQGVILAEEL
jgi:hypothetical protein